MTSVVAVMDQEGPLDVKTTSTSTELEAEWCFLIGLIDLLFRFPERVHHTDVAHSSYSH